MAKTIYVRAAKQDRQVVLSEYDEQHPGDSHEAWVAGDERVWEVGKTAAVMGRSDEAVKKLQARALANLRRHLAPTPAAPARVSRPSNVIAFRKAVA